MSNRGKLKLFAEMNVVFFLVIIPVLLLNKDDWAICLTALIVCELVAVFVISFFGRN